MARKFKTGDVVCVKSDTKEVCDKYPMTIRMYTYKEGGFNAMVASDFYEYDVTSEVICDWRNAQGDVCEKKFLEDELSLID